MSSYRIVACSNVIKLCMVILLARVGVDADPIISLHAQLVTVTWLLQSKV